MNTVTLYLSKKGKRNVIYSEYFNDKFKENDCFVNLLDILIGCTCKYPMSNKKYSHVHFFGIELWRITCIS